MVFRVHDLMVDILPEPGAGPQELRQPVALGEWPAPPKPHPKPHPKPEPRPKPGCIPISVGPGGYFPVELASLAVLREQLRHQLRS
jgi:hypothetical protein